jgi:hypothetical protein
MAQSGPAALPNANPARTDAKRFGFAVKLSRRASELLDPPSHQKVVMDTNLTTYGANMQAKV